MDRNKYAYCIQKERERLIDNSFPDFMEGLGKNFIVKCSGNADYIIHLSREIMLILNEQYENYSNSSDWNDLDRWADILPSQFVNNFVEIGNKKINGGRNFLEIEMLKICGNYQIGFS